MPPAVWFVVALVTAGGGALLLVGARSLPPGPHRDRRRWAHERGWAFVEVEPALPSRWRYGTVHQGGPGLARGLVTGAVPGPDGRRLAHVFDHEQDGRVTATVAAVRGVAATPVPLELRLPSAPPHDPSGLVLFGPVGSRRAFVADEVPADPPVTAALSDAADRVGDDVPLLWVEDTWVLATLDRDAAPGRVEALLTGLVTVSVALDGAAGGPRCTAAPGPTPAPAPAPAPDGAPEGGGPSPGESARSQ